MFVTGALENAALSLGRAIWGGTISFGGCSVHDFSLYRRPVP